jgi:hypothetical protein
VGELGLNLRTRSSAASAISAVLPKDTRVAVLGEAFNGTTRWLRVWCRIKGIERVGWVAARYVERTG